MSQKLDFVKKVVSGAGSMSALCRKYNISRTLGYRYLKRYQEEGSTGLVEKSRVPHSSPHQTKKSTENLIVQTRKEFPDWGARKIHRLLAIEKPSLALPSVSTINAIFKRHGLIDKEESLKRQALSRFERENPNDLWQMDYKGRISLTDKTRCYPLTLLDDHSRFSLAIQALPDEKGKPLKAFLEGVFRQYGLPKQINVDNGNPWGNSGRGRHTHFSVWLLRLGILVTHSRPRHPQTNGKIERFHRTFKQEVLKHNEFPSFIHAQKAFDEWRELYNYRRPHEALEMKVPSERYQPSFIPFPEKLPAIEYEEQDRVRKVRGNGYITFKSKEYRIGEAFKGFYVAIRASEVDGEFFIYFGQNSIRTISLIMTRNEH